MRYYLNKLGFYLIAGWIAITLNFLLPRLVKGSPVDVILAKTQGVGPMPPEARHALELQFGVSHEPLIVQYGQYLHNLFTGDFGLSVSYYPTPAIDVVMQALPWTVALVGLATVISYVIGIVFGSWLGWRRGTWTDSILPASTFFSAIPYFWLALVLVYIFGSILHWFPVSGGYDFTITPGFTPEFIGSVILYGMLPAITIILASVSGQLLGTRNMMVSTMAEDYVVTARAKGLRPRRVFGSYAMRNALLPSVAGFAMSLGFIVNGSVVTESVFGYPGVGFTLLTAVQNNDYPLMQALFLVITLAVLGANLVVDLIYGFIDPRTRLAN
ncbi:ABC transporter permease [Leifsonia poae]|uniref:Peptide ABC transporter permease n=1 Tax=Leifsonia poae TaxID=110933 RepID=A0A9W6HB24_9MICO|nr:ABC transporter permease [Leifsonia poae]GLJ76632.1 peptide ABC transporter permease [Leifsonia poae]